jgi:hypothetical protein
VVIRDHDSYRHLEAAKPFSVYPMTAATNLRAEYTRAILCPPSILRLRLWTEIPAPEEPNELYPGQSSEIEITPTG